LCVEHAPMPTAAIQTANAPQERLLPHGPKLLRMAPRLRCDARPLDSG